MCRDCRQNVFKKTRQNSISARIKLSHLSKASNWQKGSIYSFLNFVIRAYNFPIYQIVYLQVAEYIKPQQRQPTGRSF